uniref:Uncharacterized protein n=1 Tax=Heterorhabditis bacteriophora TaxID=37862 RepID=A0A1I7XQI1_HETBA
MYQPELQYIPPISEPRVHLGVRQFQRQAKSFDERGSAIANARRRSVEPDRTFARQNTVQMLQPETPVAAACQSLWAAKGHLEQLQALGINDPSSASTSFESNTENNQAPNVLDVKDREKNAENKRLIYNTRGDMGNFPYSQHLSEEHHNKSHGLRKLKDIRAKRSSRNHIITSLQNRKAVLVRGTVLKMNGKQGGTAICGYIFFIILQVNNYTIFTTISNINTKNNIYYLFYWKHRRILLMENKTASSPQIQPHPTTSIEPIDTAKDRIGRRIAERDYRRHRSYTRQMSVGGVTVPLICYSDVQNCSR